MIQIHINDRELSMPEGTTVLEAARQNGIHIPTLCFHPALKPSGSCRLCGVEVIGAAGRSTVMLSCLLKAKPGMRMRTDSDAVAAARTKALERLFKMAPMSQRLRDVAAREGIELPPAPDGCIRCRLCIRVCKEIVGPAALSMERIDGRQTVVPDPGRCIGCGTCANLCPTQAISVSDRDGVRTMRLRGEIIGQHPLERCEGCGKYYASVRHVQLMEQRTAPHPHVKVHHNYCPTCAKLFSDRLVIMQRQPPRPR